MTPFSQKVFQLLGCDSKPGSGWKKNTPKKDCLYSQVCGEEECFEWKVSLIFLPYRQDKLSLEQKSDRETADELREKCCFKTWMLQTS